MQYKVLGISSSLVPTVGGLKFCLVIFGFRMMKERAEVWEKNKYLVFGKKKSFCFL